MSKAIILLQDLELIPVIEDEYLKNTEIDVAAISIEPGFVPISRLHERDLLQQVLDVEFAERNFTVNYLEETSGLTALCGGGLFRCNGELLIEPQCCGDLGDISEWEWAVNYQGAKWHELSIGHPRMSVRYVDKLLIISDYHEPDEKESLIEEKYALSPDLLDKLVKQVILELEAWAHSMTILLQEILSPNAAKLVAKFLTGNLSREK